MLFFFLFRDKWIGRGSQQIPTPFDDWPHRIQDLTFCENALWGIIKEKVSHERHKKTQQLKDAVPAAFAPNTKYTAYSNITQNMAPNHFGP